MNPMLTHITCEKTDPGISVTRQKRAIPIGYATARFGYASDTHRDIAPAKLSIDRLMAHR
jgi:hypothetical protein